MDAFYSIYGGKRLEELNKFIRRGMKEEESKEEPLLQGEPLEAPGHVE